MNIKKKMKKKNSFLQLKYNDSNTKVTINEHLRSWLPNTPHEYIILCIGSDRSTGDSLGPLCGTMLQERKLKHLTIYGTLKSPVHAQNLIGMMQHIHAVHKNPYIIAIDACLGKIKSVGHIITGIGPIVPGAALKKDLPEVGDLHLTGVVNTGGFMEFAVLQNTRLSHVFEMANVIADILNKLDMELHTTQPMNAFLPAVQRKKNVLPS